MICLVLLGLFDLALLVRSVLACSAWPDLFVWPSIFGLAWLVWSGLGSSVWSVRSGLACSNWSVLSSLARPVLFDLTCLVMAQFGQHGFA